MKLQLGSKLVFGTGPVRLGPDGDRLRESFASGLGQALGQEVRVVASRSYSDLRVMLSRGDVQVAWMSPALALRAVDDLGAQALVSSVRAPGSQFYGVLFARGDGRAKKLEDLRGKRVAWVDRESCSGYLFPRLALVAAGYPLAGLFAEERLLGSHDAVARAVVTGEVDVGATYFNVVTDEWDDGQVAAGWSELTFDPIRALLRTELIPADLVVAAPSMDDATRTRLVTALCSLHGNPRTAPLVTKLFGAFRFTPADLSRYSVVRDALRASI
jgi:phosphonate transport system substrate-binding protein